MDYANNETTALITGATDNLDISTTTLTGGTTNTRYIATLVGTGGFPEYRWTVTTGTLPAGLTLDETSGILAGTPTATGTSNFTVTATDLTGQTTKQALTLTIA